MNKKVLWGLGIGLLGAILVKNGISGDKENTNTKKTPIDSKPKKIKVGCAEKSNYELLVDAGIEKEYKSIEFVLDKGFNVAKLGTVYMDRKDAKEFIPIKNNLNKNELWAIHGENDPI